jgi:hypothetical protein
MIKDFDLDFLRDAANLVDGRLETLGRKAESSPNPDSFGIYDEVEYITGFGFVACQTYITATIGRIGMEKREALDLGPRHRTGSPFVALLNACANHWKHSAEWRDQELRRDTRRTLKTIASLGVDTDGSYPIANALYHLLAPHPTRFAPVLPFLVQWRDTVRAKQPYNTNPINI